MKRAARLMRLAHALRGEADRHLSTKTRDELVRAATQLVRLASSADVVDPEHVAQLDAFEEAAIDLLVSLMTQRAERMLAEGATP